MRPGVRIYNLFPLLCGEIGNWDRHLDRIAGMAFDWIFVNPFHQPGHSGSLYAVKDYYAYHPLLVPAGADGNAQLKAFTDACAERGIGVIMDLVINHTAKDAVLTEQHPNWYRREANGELVSAHCEQADGSCVYWDDLAELAYENDQARAEMVGYWSDLVRHYIGLGIRGFRCDAAYQIPADVWTPLIQAARAVSGDVLFSAETLGCTPEQSEALEPAGFDYIFNSAAWWDYQAPYLLEQYERYRCFAPSIAFPESHDTDRLVNTLAEQGITEPAAVEAAYRSRYLFAATFSTGIMIPAGFEYGFRQRLHVADTRPEHWETPAFDLTDFIAEVNEMRAAIPAFNEEGPQQQIELDHGDRLTGLLRHTNDSKAWAITLINRDQQHRQETRLAGLATGLTRAREMTPDYPGEIFERERPIVVDPGEIRIFTSAE
jgi:starch synthase (maltosyl-transferring)